MKLEALPWLILFLPLLSAAAITLFPRKNRDLSAKLSIGAIVSGFLLSVLFIAANGWLPERRETLATWLEVGDLQVDFGLRLDPLSLLMLLVVTGVGGAIHVYSWGYMREDRGFSRYFAGLSLFTFSMLGIVLANNFLMLFIFWELVGVSSYLLIGHWFERPSAADACKKAFLTNRLGDFGFLLGILLVWGLAGGLNFSLIEDALRQNPALFGSMATGAGLLIFCGAAGKSAQFPLHVWLPDAMEGPTPVSALIHAATMVAAGVYMLCRVFFIFNASSLHVIAWVGAITALMAALMAIQQNDIKRILAYSTLSQLGYMVMAVGLGGPTPAMFHLSTHAFFKALLFLAAGSVIVALHHEQDIWEMGGLSRNLNITFVTFLIGALALMVCPPFSGFFSKDAILALAYEHNMSIFVAALGTALLTAFYITRLLVVVFLGQPSSHADRISREPPFVMIGPLIVLALFVIVGGSASFSRRFVVIPQEMGFSESVPLLAMSALVLGAGLAIAFYKGHASETFDLDLLRRRFYFDEFYRWLIDWTQELLARISAFFDRWIIDAGAVRGASGGTCGIGSLRRLLQVGK